MDALARLNQTFEGQPETIFGNATVTNAAAGTFGDGRKKITVNWRDATFDAAYADTYTPTNGDIVLFVKEGSSLTVICKHAR